MTQKSEHNFVFAIVIIAIFIVFASVLSWQIEKTMENHDSSHANSTVLERLKTKEKVFSNPSALSYNRDKRKKGAKVRTLAEFYKRRAYPGAPPFIPHPVSKDGVIADSCLTCHENGGYVQSYNAYAPLSPHPEKENCRQCHVPLVEEKLFVKSDWEHPKPPMRKVTALAGSPPRMPHGLQLRENCLSCHGGPAAVEEIRVSHPERENCMQCHIPQREKKIYESKLGKMP